MRNWNQQRGPDRSRPTPASRLPMRNWNSAKTQYSTFSKPSFQTTYEELKHAVCDRVSWFCKTLPDYLWGIETLGTSCFRIHRKASRLPMRNWNRSLRRPITSGFSFQTTYEELKPSVNGHKYYSSFGFQTTYEELKLPRSVSLTVIISASRLPMRNWNDGSWESGGSQPTLPDYLWGIETYSW